jgi:methionyl aminopeptidase
MEDYKDWILSGKIASQAREYSKSLIKPGEKLFDIAEKIEAKIKELNAELAFPVNLSMNETAAHYTPFPEDDIILNDEILKVDLGTSVNGAIGDTAYTFDLSGKYSDLVKSSEEAVNNAAKLIQIGTTLGEIGKTIQETIQSYGFSSVKNLSGHGLGRYEIHSSPQIPNYDTHDKTVLTKGMLIAIEPFATNGIGMIKESGAPMIYSQIGKKPVRDFTARKVLDDISHFKELPFATRWLTKKYTPQRLNLALRSLSLAGNLHSYPPLVEVSKGIVAQTEHSFLIDDKVIMLTK